MAIRNTVCRMESQGALFHGEAVERQFYGMDTGFIRNHVRTRGTGWLGFINYHTECGEVHWHTYTPVEPLDQMPGD